MITLTKLIHNIHSSIEQELGERRTHVFGERILTEQSDFFTGLLYYNMQSVNILQQLLNSEDKIVEERIMDTFQMGNCKYVNDPVSFK
jgi:hypothetical protein